MQVNQRLVIVENGYKYVDSPPLRHSDSIIKQLTFAQPKAQRHNDLDIPLSVPATINF